MDFELKPTTGLSGGDVIQFADGSWEQGRAIGAGVAISEDAFDLIEPYLQQVWLQWAPARRYGVTELPAAVRVALVGSLKAEAAGLDTASESDKRSLFEGLAAWLAQRLGPEQSVSIFGI